MHDKEIIEMYWARNERAIAETENKYGRYCHRIANNILENIDDADECVNDTWLRTWNAIPDERPDFFQGFLAKITRRIAINRWKYLRADKRGGSAVSVVLDELEECVAGSSDAASEFEANELSKMIDNFVRDLSEREQKIFILRYFYMETVRDIAERSDISENNVSVILSRVRDKLRSYLRSEGYEI